MALNKAVRVVRDVLSYCGIGFLVVMGFQQGFGYSGSVINRPRVWFGCLILASAFAIADRLRRAGKTEGTTSQQPVRTDS